MKRSTRPSSTGYGKEFSKCGPPASPCGWPWKKTSSRVEVKRAMALPTSNANFDALAPRAAGQLITSADWNALVAASKSVQDALNSLSQAVDTRLSAVETEANQIKTQLQTVVTDLTALEAIVRQYSHVTLKPSQAVYTLGETAVITAQVTDVAGQPPVFHDANRPWVTFVCTWGRLRAVPGFTTSGGEGDRTVT